MTSYNIGVVFAPNFFGMDLDQNQAIRQAQLIQYIIDNYEHVIKDVEYSKSFLFYFLFWKTKTMKR